jgi:hypothetical protein
MKWNRPLVGSSAVRQVLGVVSSNTGPAVSMGVGSGPASVPAPRLLALGVVPGPLAPGSVDEPEVPALALPPGLLLAAAPVAAACEPAVAAAWGPPVAVLTLLVEPGFPAPPGFCAAHPTLSSTRQRRQIGALDKANNSWDGWHGVGCATP